MVIGNGIFALGAMMCVFAPSIEVLLITRFIQGLGAATSAVVISAMIGDLYKADQASKLYGLMNGILTILMALAPVLGGLINNTVGWRGNYGAVALICTLSWVFLVLGLRETKQTRSQLNVSQVFQDYKMLFSNGVFLSAATIPSLTYGAYMVFVAIAPFLYMDVFQLGILEYTLHQGVVVAGFSVTSIFAGKITDFCETKNTIWIALFSVILSAFLMLFASSPYMFTVLMTLFCMGTALLYPIIFAHSMEIFPDLKGTASSAITSLRYLLCSLITGIASYTYDGRPLTLAIVICVVTAGMCVLSVYFLSKMKFDKEAFAN